MKSFLRGLGVALVTPFQNNGDIDFKSLTRLVDHVVDGGVDYIVALGTTAETPTLFPEERVEVVNHIKKQTAGRAKLVVGIGGNNTAALIKAMGTFDLDGVSAILSVTPFYNRPSQRGLYEHYKALASAAPVPVILYNVPSRTGVNMLPSTTIALAREVDNIIAIKEACGDVGQFEELLRDRPEGFAVVSGDDCLSLPLIRMGGEGLISVAANAFPAYYSKMIRKALAGEFDQADKEWETIDEITRMLFEEGNPTGVKAALAAKGIISNNLRLPLTASTGLLYDRILEIIGQNRF